MPLQTDKITFKLGKTEVDIEYSSNGEALNITSREGNIVVQPRFSNGIEVRAEPYWGRATMVRILAHAILQTKNPKMNRRSLAENLYELMRGL